MHAAYLSDRSRENEEKDKGKKGKEVRSENEKAKGIGKRNWIQNWEEGVEEGKKKKWT